MIAMWEATLDEATIQAIYEDTRDFYQTCEAGFLRPICVHFYLISFLLNLNS